MNKLFLFLATLVLVFANPVRAFASNDFDLFNRMIDVQRDADGKLIQLMIKSKLNSESFNADGKSQIASEFMKELGTAHPMLLTAHEASDLSLDGWTAEDIANYNDAQKKLMSPEEMKALLSNKDVGNILSELEKGLNFVFQYNVLAKPGVPGYFHDRKIIDKLINKAKKAAEKALGAAPALKVVYFLIDETIGMVESKREYCQNVLLYYLEMYPPETMGLTTEEVAFIKSSIYENTIGWLDFKKLKEAKKHWDTFGPVLFDKQVASNAKRLNKYGPEYGTLLENYNFSFTGFQEPTQGYIVMNTFDKRWKFNADLSFAYRENDPKALLKMRIELRLAQFAASFLPIPGFALGKLQGLLSSYYGHQKIEEGGLYAYFMAHGRTAEANIVLDQSINPFLIFELK